MNGPEIVGVDNAPDSPPADADDYDVFISYRHSDGLATARRLRRWLLSYRLPQGIEAARTGPLRVYLDTYGGKVTTDFWQATLEPALRRARFLLLVASPAAATAPRGGGEDWVAKEIETFLSLPQRQNIIPALTPANRARALPPSLLREFPHIQVIDLGSRDSFVPLLPGIEDPGWLEFLRIVAAIREVPDTAFALLFREERRRRVRRMAALLAATAAVLFVVAAAGLQALANGIAATRVAAATDTARALERSADRPDEAALVAARALHTVDRSWIIAPFLGDERARIRTLLPQLKLPESGIAWTGGRVAAMVVAPDGTDLLLLTETGRLQGYTLPGLSRRFDVALPFPHGPNTTLTRDRARILVTGWHDGQQHLAVFDHGGAPGARRRLPPGETLDVLPGGRLLHHDQATGTATLVTPDMPDEGLALSGKVPRVEWAGIAGDRLVLHVAADIGVYQQRIYDLRTGNLVGTPQPTHQLGPAGALDAVHGMVLHITREGHVAARRLADGSAAGPPIPLLFGQAARRVVIGPSGRVALERDGAPGAVSLEVWSLADATPRLLMPPVSAADIFAGPLHDPSGRRVAVALRDGVRILDLEDGSVRTLASGVTIGTLAWSADGRRLATADHGGRIVEWDPATAQPLQTGLRHHEGFVDLAYAGGALLSAGHDGSLRRTSPPSPARPAVESGPVAADHSRSTTISLDRSGARIVVARHHGEVSLCDVAGSCAWTRTVPAAPVAAFAGDDAVLVGTPDQPGFRLLDARDGRTIAAVPDGFAASSPARPALFVTVPGAGISVRSARDGGVTCASTEAVEGASRLAIAPDGRRAVAIDPAGNAVAFDMDRCRSAWRRNLGIARTQVIRFSPDGTLLAAGGASGGAVFHVGDGSAQGLAFDDRHVINDIAFHPTRPQILTAGMSRRVVIHDIARRTAVLSPLVFDAIPWAVAFDPAGHRFAVGLWADSAARFGVRLFDSTTGTPIGPLLPHGHDVMALAFTGGGAMLATGSADGMSRLWPLPSDRRTARAVITAVARSTGQTIDLESGAIFALPRDGHLPP